MAAISRRSAAISSGLDEAQQFLLARDWSKLAPRGSLDIGEDPLAGISGSCAKIEPLRIMVGDPAVAPIIFQDPLAHFHLYLVAFGLGDFRGHHLLAQRRGARC